jgi:hypothetical protein
MLSCALPPYATIPFPARDSGGIAIVFHFVLLLARRDVANELGEGDGAARALETLWLPLRST